MKIAVCIKQVPVIARIRFDYETKTIVREGVPLEVNSYDLLAVDRAVELAAETGGEVTVFTMGPAQARDALVQCLAMGAQRAIHLTDRAMAGSDTLATARCLSLALGREEFDLVMCGRHSNDAETGQVGPELAELLQVPHVSNVRKLDYSAGDSSITVERETDEGYEVIRCPLPGLVTVTEGIMEERFPSREAMQAAIENPAIEEVTAAQLSPDSSIFGSAGSPTRVSEIRLVEPQRLGVIIEEPDPQAAARQVVEGLIKKGPSAKTSAPDVLSRYPGKRERSIWVVAERVSSGLRRATFEILGKANELAQHTHSEVAAVLLGQGSAEDINALGAYGADRVFAAGPHDLGHPAGLAATAMLARAIEDHQPYAVLFPSTANGRDLSSRVAGRLGLGLTGDCIDLEMNEKGEMVQLKPALGGNVVAPILSLTLPCMATMRPGLLSPIAPDWDAQPEVETLEPLHREGPDITLLEAHPLDDARGLELETAPIVLAVGMGIGGPENLPAIYKLAESIGAVVAATRNVTDAGWLPRQVQVGLTGRAVAPELYIAVGIRGDFNHTVGIQKAGTILAINSNPNPRRSPIFSAADFSIVGDWQTHLPPLIEALKPIAEGYRG